MNLADALLKQSKALPADASAVTSDAIDLQVTPTGDFLANCEFLLEAPALATGELGDDDTMTYDLVASEAADLSNPVTLASALITQTGAGGAGAAAATARYRPPTDVKRYVGFKATNSAAGDASGKSATLSLRC
ncbi:hypothetical protein [Stratiformator vulcanicus]|uniref:Uncharacterized protein n=1 Tax=Stratiformator vulcanicus TaxID=2527980 RepID=A0A517R770_9PLAN|nr:hypothetical protein [Stratiformator vulcanicus]QDT39730.1 hypothetical protein Pan189_41390 [Stratiformator vulcanicus]